ncbi:MAG: putative addiction module antidote protein [Micavibrio aeruginosavorus]|uniref:Putative addiction module antidote protein n=1 Tax=Micavibrio aeruginosavorus TaxID=349221 RepID=A0A2W5C4G1_9BACT|nr:MAG: putative addiction module antidote protein [Micavibrio aeruginosavorus]
MERKYQTLDEFEEEILRNQKPEDIDAYMEGMFEEFAEDGNVGALLASLRVIAKVKGISGIAEETGLTRQGLQKALSEKGNPRFESINAIMKAMGYRLVAEKIDAVHA